MIRLLALGALLTAACSSLPKTPERCAIRGAAYRQPPVAADSDAHPERARVRLVAEPVRWQIAPGCVVEAWGYNGSVPGPTIEANVGDLVTVELVNHLPEATTIHWHGLRVPAAMDGTEVVQRAVAPGETFIYSFVVPDAGTFWYHPHANETVQMERGLYGAFVVRGDDGLRTDWERVLVLDDVLLGEAQEILPPQGLMERHDGREGNVLVVSGQAAPRLSMSAGQVERLRFVNAASARFFRLGLSQGFTLVGSDGGLWEQPVRASEVLLTPGDRVELLVGPLAPGRYRLEALPYDRGAHARDAVLVAELEVGAAAPSMAHVPASFAPVQALVGGTPRVTREVRLGGAMSLTKLVSFTIDGHEHGDGAPVRVGDLEVWEVINEAPIDHPFHLHGFFFQVLEVNGVRPQQVTLEDTVNVPARGRVRIAWVADDRPGLWMYHCHILEHAAAGMMAHFEVLPRGATASAREVDHHPTHAH